METLLIMLRLVLKCLISAVISWWCEVFFYFGRKIHVELLSKEKKLFNREMLPWWIIKFSELTFKEMYASVMRIYILTLRLISLHLIHRLCRMFLSGLVLVQQGCLTSIPMWDLFLLNSTYRYVQFSSNLFTVLLVLSRWRIQTNPSLSFVNRRNLVQSLSSLFCIFGVFLPW